MLLFDNSRAEQTVQDSFDYPVPFTEKYRPQTVSDFISLEKPKALVMKLAAKPFSSAWIFEGPSGTGKTTMAIALARMIPAELHHIPSQECTVDNIDRARKICQYVPMSPNKFHLVLVDEADRMTPAAQVSLLSKLDSTDFPPNTIFIFTCNSTKGLEDRFLSRCHKIEFSSYGLSKSATELLESIWAKEFTGDFRPDFARIVKDSSNNVRECLNRLETEAMLNAK